MLGKGFLLDEVPARVSWRAVAAMRAWADRTSAVFRCVHGVQAAWGDLEHLMAVAADELRWQSYALAVQGGNAQAEKPMPLDRPGMATVNRNNIAGASMTLEQTKEWLGW